MKYLILLISVLLLMGCNLPSNLFKPYHNLEVIGSIGSQNMFSAILYSAVIEDCEYLYIAGGRGFTHKGNCSNPIHGGRE